MKIRRRAGAFIISKDKRLFLFKFDFSFLEHEKTLWVTPGGGVDDGESFERGLERELYEELGISVTVSTPHVFVRRMPLKPKHGEEFMSDERYFIVNVPDESVTFDNMTSDEKNLTKDGRWWSTSDIRLSNEEFFTEGLASILEDIINGNLPPAPREI